MLKRKKGFFSSELFAEFVQVFAHFSIKWEMLFSFSVYVHLYTSMEKGVKKEDISHFWNTHNVLFQGSYPTCLTVALKVATQWNACLYSTDWYRLFRVSDKRSIPKPATWEAKNELGYSSCKECVLLLSYIRYIHILKRKCHTISWTLPVSKIFIVDYKIMSKCH